METILFKVECIEKLLATRKMTLSDINDYIQYSGDCVEIKNLSSLLSVCRLTAINADEFLFSSVDKTFSKKNPVVVSRAGGSWERIKGDNLEGGYHYRHVLKTNADPGLLVLRTTPLSSKDNVVVNTGHLVKEIVYVLTGKVGLIWKNLHGEIRNKELDTGDSVYIDSFVPHAFYSIIPDSEILAVDYL